MFAYFGYIQWEQRYGSQHSAITDGTTKSHINEKVYG